MAAKISLYFFFVLIVGFTVGQDVPWRSKIKASPPRPSAPGKPTTGAANTKCGGTLRIPTAGQHSVITSPGYPNDYAAGLDCEWAVVGEPDSRIHATFFDIRTQNVGFSDISDSVYLSLSGNWSESQRLSGDLNAVTPLTVISDSNKLLVRFKSSSFSTGNRGFRIIFYESTTGKPAATEIGHDTWTVISCNYVPVDHPQVFPDEGQSLKEVTRTNENPFLVGLILDERQFCAGTLVSKSHVVTSAHCTKGANRIDLVFGTSDLLANDAGVQRRTVNASSVREHPYFDTFSGGNDISVIILDEPVTLNEFVTPAALPTWSYIGTTLKGLKADIVGWGDAKNGNGNIFSQANSQVARVASNAACRTSNRGNTGHSLCTQGNSTSDCQTDSGSPIITRGNICGGQINQGGQNNANAADASQHNGQKPPRPHKPVKPNNKPNKPGKPHKPNRPHLFADEDEPTGQQAALLLGIVSHGSCEKGFSATRITAYLDFLSETVGPLDPQ